LRWCEEGAQVVIDVSGGAWEAQLEGQVLEGHGATRLVLLRDDQVVEVALDALRPHPAADLLAASHFQGADVGRDAAQDGAPIVHPSEGLNRIAAVEAQTRVCSVCGDEAEEGDWLLNDGCNHGYTLRFPPFSPCFPAHSVCFSIAAMTHPLS